MFSWGWKKGEGGKERGRGEASTTLQAVCTSIGRGAVPEETGVESQIRASLPTGGAGLESSPIFRGLYQRELVLP